MIWLLVAIFSAGSLFVQFKLWERYAVNNFPAIVINYIVAFLIGLVIIWPEYTWQEAWDKPFLLPMFLLGTVFIGIFLAIAVATQKIGVSVATVATKMGMAIPVVVFIIIFDHEHMTWLKGCGLVLALLAVWLTSARGKAVFNTKALLLLPVIIFLGNGLIDFSLAYFSGPNFLTEPHDVYLMTSMPFAMSGIIGTILLLVNRLRGKKVIGRKEIIAGATLGTINFGAIWFFIEAVGAELLDKSAIVPIINLGIVLMTTLAAVVVFKEKLNTKNLIGLAVAIIAITLFWLG